MLTVLTACVTEITPILRALWIEGKLKRKMRPEESSENLGEEHAHYIQLDLSELIASHEIELRRRAAVQQRVQTNAATIAVSSGLITAALALLGDDAKAVAEAKPVLLWLLRISFTCVVVSLLMSGLGAIRAIGIHMQYDNYIQNRVARIGAEGEDEAERTSYVKMILFNQGYNLIITNYAAASFKSMRNALLALALMLLAVVWWA